MSGHAESSSSALTRRKLNGHSDDVHGSEKGSDRIPKVKESVRGSVEVWARDLRSLAAHAKERFGDVSWESEDGPEDGEKVWGHKAIIYARAPKAFKERYFISRPFSKSPGPASLRSPSPAFLPTPEPSRPGSPPKSNRAPSSFRRPSPRPTPSYAGQSTLSVNTIASEGTIRASSDGILRLTHGDTPELFRAQLEWLYTGEGFGDVVEWISAEDDSGIGRSIRDSLGRRGDLEERRDKLGQDLTYMWRSKLYADVRIHLSPEPPSMDEPSSDDSESSTDSLSSTAVFTAHRSILVSRSPYFASVLLNPSSFRPHTADIHLATPPFTPAALHFCLGYIYAGHLDFSNRTFDLLTAFQIHRAAAYLQLETLVREVEARLLFDFCHGLDPSKLHCRRCAARAGRVWRFATASDVGAVDLAAQARVYIVTRWGDSWGRDVATAEAEERDSLVKDVLASIKPDNVVSAFRSIEMIRGRIDTGLRTKGRASAFWIDPLETMNDRIQGHAREVLMDNFSAVAESEELWDVVSGKGFDHDLLEKICHGLVDACGTARECVEGPRVYQALVSSILLKVDPDTLQTALSAKSRGRQLIETAKEGVLAHIRRRWMQIKDAGGFDGLENWSLKEISDEIEVPVDDLLTGQPYTPARVNRLAPTTGGRGVFRSSIPRVTPTRLTSPSRGKATATRASQARLSISARPNGPHEQPDTPTDASGLRRLRLSSSASTSSMSSRRSSVATHPNGEASMTGPQARSPTAAKRGSIISIGSTNRRSGPSSPTPSSRTGPRAISGPPRPLMSRPAARPDTQASTSPRPQSIASVRTARTALSTTTVTKPGPRTSVASSLAGPSANGVKTRIAQFEAGSTKGKSVTNGSSTRPASKVAPTTPRKAAATRPVLAANGDGSPESRARTLSLASRVSVRSQAPSVAGSVTSQAPSITPSMRSQATSSAASPRKRATVVKAEDAASIASTRTITRAPQTPSRLIKSTSARSLTSPTKASPAMTSTQPTTPSRIRTSSTASTASTRSKQVAKAPAPPVPPLPKPQTNLAPALPNNVTRSGVRSPSSSTDGTEAQTPKLSETLLPSIEPTIRRDGSDSSDLAAPSQTSGSPTKIPTLVTSSSSSPPHAAKAPRVTSSFPKGSTLPPPPPVAINRPARKISNSSAQSTASGRRHPASAFDPPRRSEIKAPVKKEITDGSKPFQGPAVALNIGIPCIVSLKTKRARFKALIKYIGHMEGSSGPWLGLETEDLDRFGIKTLSTGSNKGIHYFHLSDPDPAADIDLDDRMNRQRHIDQIRENMGKSSIMGLGLGMTHGAVNGYRGFGSHLEGGASGRGPKRSMSPSLMTDWGMGSGIENPRVLFVRPSEVVYVIGAE